MRHLVLLHGQCLAAALALLVQTPPQQPSDVARALVAQGVLVDVPVKGQVRREIEKDAPTFQTPIGATTAMVLKLPAYDTPYLMTISSWMRGIGPATRMFVPSGISFDANFRALSHFGEENLRREKERLAVDLLIGDKLADARYFLLFTRGNQVKETLALKDPTRKDTLANTVGEKLGFGRVLRSLDATIYAATAPIEPAPLAKKLGGPWLRVEGANEKMLRQLLGEPASIEAWRNARIWTYDKTAAGKVKVYVIDDVASLRAPK